MKAGGNGWSKGSGIPARAWGGLLVLGLVLVLAAACGGGGSDNGSPTPQATGVASPGVTTAAPCQMLVDAKTYRYAVKVTLESPETTETPTSDLPLPSPTLTRPFTGPFLFQYNVDAAVVMPDRYSYTVATEGAEPFGIITIGQDTWTQLNGQWQVGAQAVSIGYEAIPICQAILPELDLSKLDPKPEDVDGQASLHYTSVGNASPQGVGKVFGVGSDMDLLISTLDVDLWLSKKDNALVRLDFQGKGLYSDGRPLMVHVVLDVRDINDKNIKIEPPI